MLQQSWESMLSQELAGVLEARGIQCSVCIETEDCRRSPSLLCLGADRVICDSVICRIRMTDGDGARRLCQRDVMLSLQSELRDRLPPEWRFRIVYVRPGLIGQPELELDLPLFDQARFGRFEMMKGDVMTLQSNHARPHPFVAVLLHDVQRALGSQVPRGAWETARGSLEEIWRNRFRYRVDDGAVIPAENYELLWNSVLYLLDRFGLPEPDMGDREGGGFSTRGNVR